MILVKFVLVVLFFADTARLAQSRRAVSNLFACTFVAPGGTRLAVQARIHALLLAV